jgi:transcriptional regulator with GAF, ATPase, and Fis domain
VPPKLVTQETAGGAEPCTHHSWAIVLAMAAWRCWWWCWCSARSTASTIRNLENCFDFNRSLPDVLFQPSCATTSTSSSTSLDEIEREHVMRILSESSTLQDAAENLGINVTTLWRKRKRYKLD